MYGDIFIETANRQQIPLQSVTTVSSHSPVMSNGTIKNNNQCTLKHYLNEIKNECLEEDSEFAFESYEITMHYQQTPEVRL